MKSRSAGCRLHGPTRPALSRWERSARGAQVGLLCYGCYWLPAARESANCPPSPAPWRTTSVDAPRQERSKCRHQRQHPWTQLQVALVQGEWALAKTWRLGAEVGQCVRRWWRCSSSRTSATSCRSCACCPGAAAEALESAWPGWVRTCSPAADPREARDSIAATQETWATGVRAGRGHRGEVDCLCPGCLYCCSCERWRRRDWTTLPVCTGDGSRRSLGSACLVGYLASLARGMLDATFVGLSADGRSEPGAAAARWARPGDGRTPHGCCW